MYSWRVCLGDENLAIVGSPIVQAFALRGFLRGAGPTAGQGHDLYCKCSQPCLIQSDRHVSLLNCPRTVCQKKGCPNLCC